MKSLPLSYFRSPKFLLFYTFNVLNNFNCRKIQGQWWLRSVHMYGENLFIEWVKLCSNGFTIDLMLWCIGFNATFSNISAISWRPVSVVEEAGVPRDNHRRWASNWWTLSLATAINGSDKHPSWYANHTHITACCWNLI